MKKKGTITLINTPHREFKKGEKEEDNPNYKYPIGLLLISSQLKNFNFNVKYLDADYFRKGIEDIVDFADSAYVGLNATFPNALIVKKIARALKNKNPSVKIILGGPAPTLSPSYFLKDGAVDFIVMGEGEKTIVELLEALENSKDFRNLNGIAYRDALKTIVTPKNDPINIDKAPFVDISNIPRIVIKEAKEVQIFSSRGCPGNCSFCSTPSIWGHNLRSQSVDRIFDELKNYEENGFNFNKVYFVDDNFMVRWDFVEEFMKRWKKTYGAKGYTWKCLSRVNQINDKDKIIKLVNSGCESVSIGVESASPKILRDMVKGINIESVTKFQNLAAKYGLKVKGFFMLGFPNETRRDAMKTINYISKSKFDEVGINIVVAYPGTRLHYEVYKNKFVLPKFKKRKINSDNILVINSLKRRFDSIPSISLSKYLSIEELYELVEKAYKSFYKNRGIQR